MSPAAPSGRRTAAKKHTPVMLQFLEAKEQFPDALLFFRMGDFYEFFFEDALEVTELVDLTLTSRGKGPDGEPIPMAGMPHHAAARYITELLALGRKVAICEQMADPSTVRGVVPREVVRVITPALCLEPEALDARSDCLLVAATGRRDRLGLATYEMSTAELRVYTLSSEAALMAELARLTPRELLLSPELAHLGETVALMADVAAPQERATPTAPHREALSHALGEERAAALIERVDEAGQGAAVMALAYAQAHRPGGAFQPPRVTDYDPANQLVLDEAAVRNLELLRTLSGERRGSLLALLDGTRCPMGARKLRRRMLSPLCDLSPLRRRLDAVSALVEDASCRERVRAALSGVGDMERLTTRAEQGEIGRASCRERV